MEDTSLGAHPGIGHVLGERAVLLTEHPFGDGALKTHILRPTLDLAQTGEHAMLYLIDFAKPARV